MVVMRSNLEAVTIGTLIGKIGVHPVLPQHHANFFVHTVDHFYCDSVTRKPIHEGQKPVGLVKELMELYTTPND